MADNALFETRIECEYFYFLLFYIRVYKNLIKYEQTELNIRKKIARKLNLFLINRKMVKIKAILRLLLQFILGVCIFKLLPRGFRLSIIKA